MARSLKPAETSGAALSLPTLGHVEDDISWRMLTRSANAAFAEERWLHAERLYDLALAEAERLFSMAGDGRCTGSCDPVPMLVAATANAAENWLRLGRCDKAAQQMNRLCRRMCGVICDEAQSQIFREQCFVHLKPATLELMTLLPRAGWSADRIAREIDHARKVALHFIDTSIPRH